MNQGEAPVPRRNSRGATRRAWKLGFEKVINTGGQGNRRLRRGRSRGLKGSHHFESVEIPLKFTSAWEKGFRGILGAVFSELLQDRLADCREAPEEAISIDKRNRLFFLLMNILDHSRAFETVAKMPTAEELQGDQEGAEKGEPLWKLVMNASGKDGRQDKANSTSRVEVLARAQEKATEWAGTSMSMSRKASRTSTSHVEKRPFPAACLGVWDLTSEHPCHKMPGGSGSSGFPETGDGVPKTRVLGLGLMKAGTTVVWHALGAALNMSMGMDCEALSQGEFLQAILNDFEWVMAQAVLAMAFLAEWTTRTTAMDVYTVLPVQTDSYCARGYPICSYTLACLHGYSLDCRTLGCNASETCEDLGSFFRKSDWNGMCDHWEDVENRTECCQCVGFMPPPETVAPSTSFHRCYDSADRCPDSYSGSCCFTRLDCPSGYSLSDPVGICGQTDCGIENYAVSELNYMGSYCHGVFPGDRVLCQTCVKDPGETSTSPALLTLVVTTAGPEEVATSDYTAPTHNSEECDGPCSYVLTCPSGYRLECQGVPCAEETLCSALGDFYQVKSWSNCGPQDEDRYECCRCARAIPSTGAWEMLGRPDKAACRGRTPTDNSPNYYTVHSGIDDLEDCKALCLQHFPRCKGIEHSHGRCEIWTRPEGISLGVELNVSGFTCMRFGWAAKHLVPVDGGVGRACRGSTSNDNQPSYYRIMDAETLQACQAMCTAAPLCYGIEFSSGRCEIWVERIGASVPIEGFACFAYDPAAIPVFTEKDILIP